MRHIDKRLLTFLFYMLSLDRKWGSLERYVSDIYKTMLKLHLEIVCRRLVKEVPHDLLYSTTYILIIKRDFKMFYVVYVYIVSSTKRMRFNEHTGILKEEGNYISMTV